MNYKIADSHNDFIDKLPPERVRSFLLGEVRECGVRLITTAICSNNKSAEFYTADNLNALTEPLSGSEYSRVLVEYEGLDFLSEKNLDILDKARPFSVTLTWNNDNSLAGGCRGGSGRGITDFGREVVNILNQKKIAIDTAHLNRKSFFELLDIGPAGRVYNSHTCIAELFTDNIIVERNITDEQARLITERGGFVGITLIPYFLRGQEEYATAEDVFRHIDFVVQRYGTDNIGIGSDFYGAVHYPQGISNYYGYHSIVKSMENHGYSTENIQKILYQNYKNFCDKI